MQRANNIHAYMLHATCNMHMQYMQHRMGHHPPGNHQRQEQKRSLLVFITSHWRNLLQHRIIRHSEKGFVSHCLSTLSPPTSYCLHLLSDFSLQPSRTRLYHEVCAPRARCPYPSSRPESGPSCTARSSGAWPSTCNAWTAQCPGCGRPRKTPSGAPAATSAAISLLREPDWRGRSRRQQSQKNMGPRIRDKG